MLAFLLLLLVQSIWHPIKQVSLAGATPLHDQALHTESWLDESWQQSVAHNTLSTFGFRPAAVRLVNQLRYTFFDEHTPHVIDGKNGYMFEASYRATVCGDDFLGETALKAKLDSLDRFRAQLHARGKRLVILIAPNKWRTLKKQVEWGCSNRETNYDYLVQRLRNRGYAVCDCVDLFCYDQKHNPAYPLHSKQGTHWSIYGAGLSMDYLRFAFAEEGINLPEVTVERMEETAEPRFTDKDLHELLNLMQPPKEEKLAYPELSFATQHKPRVTVVGDSYYWTYYYLKAHQGLFAFDSKFFYYNQTMFGEHADLRLPLTDDVRRQEILSSDAVLLVMSEPSLKHLGYGLPALDLEID